MRSPLVGLVEKLKPNARLKRLAEMARLVEGQPKEYKLVPLLNGRFAKVDNDDFESINAFVWHYSNGYAVRKTMGKTIWMHRVISGCPPEKQVDHINQDKRDNRRFNLRTCTMVQNQGNRWKSKHAKTSKFKGVYYCKRDQCFSAYGREGAKNKRLGTFQDERLAAAAYNTWAIGYFGEFAKLNPL